MGSVKLKKDKKVLKQENEGLRAVVGELIYLSVAQNHELKRLLKEGGKETQLSKDCLAGHEEIMKLVGVEGKKKEDAKENGKD